MFSLCEDKQFTSIWVEYFRNGSCSERLEFLMDENLVVINDLILSELIPFLKVRNQRKVISLLNRIFKHNIQIDWEQLIDYQYKCLKNGINGMGIPDLIIAQNVKQNRLTIYSLDNHFSLMSPLLKLELYGWLHTDSAELQVVHLKILVKTAGKG